MSSRNDRRYEEIMRGIMQRRAEQQRAPTRNALSAALDSVNAFGFLEDLQTRRYRRILCYGPKAVTGDTWAGVVIWYRKRGYYAYRTLTLLGIWATLESERITILVGATTLAFSGHYFNAESYNKHIRTRFDLHYDGDASPLPEAACLYSTHFDAQERLDIRQAIQATLDHWAETHMK